jgi:transcriptional regulator EpsA
MSAALEAKPIGIEAAPAADQAVVHFNGFDGGVALDAREREYFAEAVESSLQVRRMSQLFVWTQGPLQRLLPHEILVFGASSGSGTAVAFHRLCSTRYFAERHFAEVCKPGSGLVVQMMTRWSRFGAPLLVSPALRTWGCEEDWLALAQAAELKNVAAHGMRNLAGRVATYFSFSRLEREFGARLHHLLALLGPHLHETLTRVMIEERRISARVVRTDCSVTDREAEVLRWVRDGKTNHDIAHILEVSPFTVKNHIHKILRKMGVENRSHAVARAISLGILGSAEA